MTLISNDQEIELRPFLVKEEKILLTALESKDNKEMNSSIIQIIQNCILTEGINVEELPSFDLEKIFITLRMKSVSEISEISLRHQGETECDHAQRVKLDLRKVETVKPADTSRVIKLTEDMGVRMRYPSPKNAIDADEMNVKNLFKLVSSCIECVYQGEELHADFTEKEIEEWVESLSEPHLQLLLGFLANMPYLSLKLTYKCEKCKQDETYELRGLKDFFT